MRRFTRPLPKIVQHVKRKAAHLHDSEKPIKNEQIAPHPDAAAGSSEELKEQVRPRQTNTIQKLASAVHNFQAFASTIRERKPTVKCFVFSLHGYSSLRMFEAKPRACINKVFCCSPAVVE